MAIKDRSKNTPEQWEQKRKYDEAFDIIRRDKGFRYVLLESNTQYMA